MAGPVHNVTDCVQGCGCDGHRTRSVDYDDNGTQATPPRSSYRNHLVSDFRRQTGLSTVVVAAFSGAGPPVRDALPQHVISAPSFSVFRNRSYLFRRCYILLAEPQELKDSTHSNARMCLCQHCLIRLYASCCPSVCSVREWDISKTYKLMLISEALHYYSRPWTTKIN